MNITKARLKSTLRRAARTLVPRCRPAILMYHRIGTEPFDPWSMAVEAHRFAEQVDWLAANRTVLPLDEFALRHREQRLPYNAIALTFDDGYASVLAAISVLENRGLTATVFLPIEIIERGQAFWWDELARAVIGCERDTLHLDGAVFAVPPADERDRTWAPDTAPRTPRQKLYLKLWAMLYAMSGEELKSATAQLRKQIDAQAFGEDRPLSPDQIRSLGGSAISFGSHGLTHPSLPKLDATEKLREVRESLHRCEGLTGTAPAAFAYPFGDLDQASIEFVELAGYACGCATGDRFVSDRSDPFALPRLNVGNWDVAILRDMLGA
jgi:peptidoglycan/xylan/chitin deacetylase (PgdA/CDA1 family)